MYQNICDMNSIPLGIHVQHIYQYIKLLVHSILFPTHLVLILTKKPTQTEIISWCLNSLQLASAMENLKHIFTAPEIVRKTEELISEGKLLQAHKQYVR